MRRTGASLALVAAIAAGLAAVSGGSSSDPRTPPALPGQPPPFLTAAVLGDGGLTAGVDAYGDVVDLRPAPAGQALVDNPLARQRAGSVPSRTGVVPLALAGGVATPFWQAASVRQRYLPGTDVLRTSARFPDGSLAAVDCAAEGARLGCVTVAGTISFSVRARGLARIHLDDPRAQRIVRRAAAASRAWLRSTRPLEGAPPWARRLYRRSLLVLRSLEDRRTGAVAAGARDGWAYVWPRDAAAVSLALDAAGFRREARRAAAFLRGLDLVAAARFERRGRPVPGRAAQGDAWGWAAAAARAAGLPPPPGAAAWRGRADYQEKEAGDYLGNALASRGPAQGFATPHGLVRESRDPASGLDSSAAWAIRPFDRRALYPAARRTVARLAAAAGRFGMTPGGGWPDADPWTAPTAWSAWSLAALGDRRRALALLADLRRAATPAGLLPERVDRDSGTPRSTTPLAWSHAFAILALRRLWPGHPAQPGRRQRASQ